MGTENTSQPEGRFNGDSGVDPLLQCRQTYDHLVSAVCEESKAVLSDGQRPFQYFFELRAAANAVKAYAQREHPGVEIAAAA